jgi:hypothetical protein
VGSAVRAPPRKECRDDDVDDQLCRCVEPPDGETASAFHSEDAVCEDVGTGNVYRGRRELAAWCQLAHQGSPDLRFHTVSEQQCGEWYAIEFEAIGTDTGK